MRIKDRIDREPVDAHVDTDAGTAVPARPGLALDVHASLERIDRALIDGAAEVQLATHVVQPGRTIAGLSDVALDATLSEFSTRHSRGEKARERTHNLRVAASKIDGHVLQPGEVFDFNEVVGDRTRAAGFKMAPVISYGKLVDGMGGGTCQIASTLHAAVFFAGLPILERHPHSRPSFYIKLGLDAAVAYGSLNFKFKNDRPYPVVIAMGVEDGFVRAALHGPERKHEVTFLRRVDETMPFEEQVVEDEELPSGLRVLAQRGIPGFRLTRLRVVRDEQTQVAVREKSTDTYPPTTQLWRVGTGPEADDEFELPRNDAHPEYVADEYMKAVAGPGIDGIDVTRKAGRTGTYGWTERENMILAVAEE
jgi:vancomycin resistance protein YoaR